MEKTNQVQVSHISAQVLVAEDNKINQKILKELLRKEGLTATIVANGKEALAVLNEQAFDILILDYHMPELNGLDTIKTIRSHANKAIHTIQVILFTAEQDPKHLKDIQAYGVQYLLQKPVNQAQFSQVIRQIINSSPVHPSEMVSSMSYLQEITNGNTILMIELMDIFIEEVPQALKKMKLFYKEQDFSSVQKLAHKLGSNYKYVGAEGAEKSLKVLENILSNESDSQAILSALQTLEKITSQIVENLLTEKQKLQ